MSRHRVISPIAKWVTAANPSQSQPAAFQGAVFSNRLGSILRTARCKPAVISQEGAQCYLVDPNQELEEFSHGFGYPEKRVDLPENLPSG